MTPGRCLRGRRTVRHSHGDVTMGPPPALALDSIVKSFPGVHALRGVSLAVRPGTVHALVGENGAGKSTLIKIATGADVADEGRIVASAARSSTARQPSRPAGARHPGDLPGAPDRRRPVRRRERRARPDAGTVRPGRLAGGATGVARERLAALGMQLDVTRPARSLSVAELQLLEIARAVSFDARVIVMDEPTASLSRHEVEPLFRVIAQLRAAGVVGAVHLPPPRRGVPGGRRRHGAARRRRRRPGRRRWTSTPSGWSRRCSAATSSRPAPRRVPSSASCPA